MPQTNCANAGINSYLPSPSKPWNYQRATHLYRRLGLGANFETITDALESEPVELINSLVTEAISMPLGPEPEWAYWQLSDYSPNEQERNEQIVQQYLTLAGQWLHQMRTNRLRDRMSWFWHSHFVTKSETYLCPSWLYQYHKLLQQHAVGNFKQFVIDMGITPAMLVFLNGIENTQFNPNENFARELLELFTLGVDNGYTQADIVDTARAVSGWNGLDPVNLCGEVTFIPEFWDSGEKTIFGQTGNWDYYDVIDLLFEHRAVEISEYICGKLYRYFINPKEDNDIINELAEIFRNNNFELAPVLEAMFGSEHFFEEANIGTIIPGHIEYFFTFINELNYAPTIELYYSLLSAMGDFDQEMFNPPDVSGWPGNRNWITSSSLQFRWEGIYNVMAYFFVLQGETLEPLRDFVISLVGENETNPATITNTLIDYMLPKGLQHEVEYTDALTVFKGEVPENYFTDGLWSLAWEYAPAQIFYLINHIANLPEFQLK